MVEGDGSCLFCRIASGEIPCKKVYEDGAHFAFLDINPRNPGHVLVIPKKHYLGLLEMSPREAGALFETARVVAEGVKRGVKSEGLSVVQSNGKAAGQVVGHVHVHLIPRYLSEGPVGLESILSVKKMTDETLEQMAGAIRTSLGQGYVAPSSGGAYGIQPKQKSEFEFD